MSTNAEVHITDRQIYETDIAIARVDFYYFCQTLHPDFYTPGRTHLKILCETLQGLYEGTLLKPDGKPYKKLMLNIPPRHGKSRTLINFVAWAFGKDNNQRAITCSYNDDEAHDFSRYTRDIISGEKNPADFYDIVYSDIFPDTKIKQDDSSYKKWALDGQFFNYKGAGTGGSITGKGGSILIIDDPIKDAETAYNDTALDKIWRWYTGTFLQRKEEGAIEIINHTRWSTGDPCGRILAGEDAGEWYILKMEAYTEDGGMLCGELLSKESYDFLYRQMDKNIFGANYHQKPVDIQGRLYKNLKTYTKVPVDDTGFPLFERIINYTDTADEGDCYLSSIVAGQYQDELWVLDSYYTKDGMEITEAETAKLLYENKVNMAKIESNNGGRGFARNVERELTEKHKSNYTSVQWFFQNKNKMARILTMSNFIMEHVYFPHNWADKWPLFYGSINTFQKAGKNKYKDAPDALTGLAEMVHGVFEFERYEAK